MFSNNDTPARRLEVVMQFYQDKCGGNPAVLRQAIPAVEIWRYFIDGVDQKEGYLPYESRESHYLASLCRAFQYIHMMDAPLTTQFIRRLHLLALNKVGQTEYSNVDDDLGDEADRIGEFRHTVTGNFGLVSDNASVAGIEEMLERAHPSLYFWLRIPGLNFEKFGNAYIYINKHSMAAIHAYEKSQREQHESGVRVHEFPHPLSSYVEADNKKRLMQIFETNDRYVKLLQSVADKEDSRQMAEFLYGMVSSSTFANNVIFASVQKGDASPLLEAEVGQLISRFESGVAAASTPMAKLKQIVGFIQACEQLHPFLDGNCRVFCMLLLNHLLMKNGFPMAILPNPNRFDVLSTDELIDNVVGGMAMTMALIDGKKIYDIDTREYVANLTPEEQAYFNSVIAIEEQGRATLLTPTPRQ